ncbi:MAG: DUF1786 domain-containing protein [Deltaproteobacteria bacterium]|nr:DUF1786 domain-containing protein [Deltaproteobacteria bacterium]
MGKYLLIDIGAGTMDILYWDDAAALHYKSVVKSPVPYLAEKIGACPGNLLVTGREMGGGAVTAVLKQRARDSRVIISKSAAATLHHDLEKVGSWGIEVVDDADAEGRKADQGLSHIELGDIDCGRIEGIVRGLGIPFEFDAVGICAQDHGVPPVGVSHLDFRHGIYSAALDEDPHAHALLYTAEEIPSSMNRLKSIAVSAAGLPAEAVFVMDSGMAAIQGASLDALATGRECVAVLDVATSHTLGATVSRGEIAGFFEYHTIDITCDRVDRLIRELGDGTLSHRQILAEGGHGAYLRRAVGFDNLENIVVTGPKRYLLADSRLPLQYGAPMGDNMMTGTLGLLASIRIRKGQTPPALV